MELARPAPPASAAARFMDIVNPATGDITARVAVMSNAEVDAAIGKAVEAQKKWWNAFEPSRRGEVLWEWGRLIERNAEAIALLDVSCTGKVISDALAETRRVARNARYWAGKTDKIRGETLRDRAGLHSYTTREPLGVFGVILPWNAPAHSFVARSVPALACGNAVVVKPSELSPLSALKLAELAAEAGMPEGLLGVVVGAGEAGAQLASHPDVGGISFTGSARTGRSVAKLAMDGFKKVTLELGGKSANIVFADADIDLAARAAVFSTFQNAGQICAAGTRVLVEASIAQAFIARLRELAGQVRVGDPRDPGSNVGPIVCRRQFDAVRHYIATGVAEGARLEIGGSSPNGLQDHPGLFVAPTIFSNVTPDMTISREEIFGPVMSVSIFESEDEAVALANATEFGLAAFVWTGDAHRSLRVADAMTAGVVHVNSSLALDAPLPFGGFKASGIGNAYGEDAIEGCTQTKRVTVATAPGAGAPPWPPIHQA